MDKVISLFIHMYVLTDVMRGKLADPAIGIRLLSFLSSGALASTRLALFDAAMS